MIISSEYKFIFVRVAKTASSSILEENDSDYIRPEYRTSTHPAFFRISSQTKYGPIPDFVFENFSTPEEFCECHGLDDPNHIPLSVSKHYLAPEDYNTYFKFGFVRNPFSRMLSAYRYACQWSVTDSFKDWLLWLTEDHVLLNKYCNQLDYVAGCDFVGRLENLQNDYDLIRDKVGLPRIELPYKNTTKHKHYTEYYDEETKQIVAEKYAKDIEYFGYKFRA